MLWIRGISNAAIKWSKCRTFLINVEYVLVDNNDAKLMQ